MPADYSVTEAHRLWSAGALAIIDVREQTEHDETRVEGIPLNVLVDRRRRIAQVRVGYAEGQQEAWLSAGIEALLDADDPPVLVVRKE